VDREHLDTIAESIREQFEEINQTRDIAYQRSRKLTSICARTIRAIHREEWPVSETLLAEAKSAAEEMIDGVRPYPALYHAGYTQDALKEYVEANLTYALVRDHRLPTPEELGIEDNTWLNGLAEAATELRRRILDILRHGHSQEVERLLETMDDIYSVLVTFDFNDSITHGLRRRTDTVRGVLERTRGDVTTSFRQSELVQALSSVETRIATESD
jgi:translin